MKINWATNSCYTFHFPCHEKFTWLLLRLWWPICRGYWKFFVSVDASLFKSIQASHFLYFLNSFIIQNNLFIDGFARGCYYVFHLFILTLYSWILCFSNVSVSRLMGSPAAGGMNMGNMSALSSCSDTKPVQFPLAQRRKRRVLFTQAQVIIIKIILLSLVSSSIKINHLLQRQNDFEIHTRLQGVLPRTMWL